jgi:crossover junction endodeoxyribonuclease RuvC
MISTKSIPTPSKRILAFDPGFERLGVAVVERIGGKETLVFSDCIRTSAKLSFPERLRELGAAAEQFIKEFSPVAVALEDIYFAKNEKTAMKVAEVRGMLAYLAAKNGLTIYEYTPTQVKVAITGYGMSKKAAISAMVPRLIVLPVKKRLDDELDAIAVGLTCLASVR